MCVTVLGSPGDPQLTPCGGLIVPGGRRMNHWKKLPFDAAALDADNSQFDCAAFCSGAMAM